MSDIPKTPSLNTQLANAVADIARAQDNLERVAQLASEACKRETEALNEVNKAQKHFDALVAEVKKSAPRDTNWRRPVSWSAE
jgi:chemotaxis regulatin CheY-phosphate phosphatase CheZ